MAEPAQPTERQSGDRSAYRRERHRAMMSHDPNHQFNERAAGLVMMGTIFFCTVTGTGVGIFFEAGVIGALIGGAVGIILGLWVVPNLLREVI